MKFLPPLITATFLAASVHASDLDITSLHGLAIQECGKVFHRAAEQRKTCAKESIERTYSSYQEYEEHIESIDPSTDIFPPRPDIEILTIIDGCVSDCPSNYMTSSEPLHNQTAPGEPVATYNKSDGENFPSIAACVESAQTNLDKLTPQFLNPRIYCIEITGPSGALLEDVNISTKAIVQEGGIAFLMP